MVNVREAVKKDLEVADPPRHRVWIKSRTKSRKLVTDYDKEIAEKIAQLEEKLSQGQIQVQGQNDILTQALGTPEHPGRVRAAGFLTRASQLFGRKKREVSDVVARQAKEIEQLKAEVQSLKQQRNAAEQEEEGEVAGEAILMTMRPLISKYISALTTSTILWPEGICTSMWVRSKYTARITMIHMLGSWFRKSCKRTLKSQSHLKSSDMLGTCTRCSFLGLNT
ncbi:hypothetical protein CsatB_023266 [Cannabis sativa]